MTYVRYHKTLPLPRACRWLHAWKRRREDRGERLVTSGGWQPWHYRECTRCGARDAAKSPGRFAAPYDIEWVQYTTFDRTPPSGPAISVTR